MPPFRFKLEPVRRLRASERDELRGKLAEAYEAAQRLANEAARIEAEITSERQRQSAGVAGESLDVNQLLDSQRYELVLKSQLADLSKKAELVEQEIDRRRQAVVAAERGVKVLDSLEERQKARSDQRAAREEQKLLDETAGVLMARRERFRSQASGEGV
ncbi:MAG: flagellar FliJ family protein [Planctomycetota bacterium]